MAKDKDPALCGVARRKPNRDGDATVVGRPCRNVAGFGTDHLGSGPCKFHGGNLPTVRRKAKNALADAALRAQLKEFGVPLRGVTPEAALLHMVREAAGNVAYLGARVAELSRELEPEDDGVPGSATPPRPPGRWGNGTVSTERGAGLFGPVIGLDRDGAEHIIGEEYRAATRLYGEWSDRLVKYAKAAVDAGIAKAQVEIAKSQGQQIVIVINRVLTQIGLDEAKQVVARQLIAQEFRSIAAGEKEATDGQDEEAHEALPAGLTR